MFFPRVIDVRKLAQKYKCPSCDLSVRIDQEKCHHCKQIFSDAMRAEMRTAYQKNVREALPYVILAFVLTVAIVFLAVM